jgi:hypothetical protein
MCAVSAVGDYWGRTLPQRDYYPPIAPLIYPPGGGTGGAADTTPAVTRHELDALRRDIEELKKLLVSAKKFDEATNQPDCEMEEKVALIKKLAKLAGVDLSEVFPG